MTIPPPPINIEWPGDQFTPVINKRNSNVAIWSISNIYQVVPWGMHGWTWRQLVLTAGVKSWGAIGSSPHAPLYCCWLCFDAATHRRAMIVCCCCSVDRCRFELRVNVVCWIRWSYIMAITRFWVLNGHDIGGIGMIWRRALVFSWGFSWRLFGIA